MCDVLRQHTFRQLTLQNWQRDLREQAEAQGIGRAAGAILPHLLEWVDRRHGGLTYRLVQVLTGHGCFGEYLHRVARREPTPRCHHCVEEEEGQDTAQHTLESCPAWADERLLLAPHFRDDFELSTMVKTMVDSEEAYGAMVSFCEQIMSQKETAERERESDPSADPARRRRPGRRKRTYLRNQL